MILQGVARTKRRRLTLGHRLFIVAPHPDDETFGTGHLIAAAIQAGRSVSVAFLTSGNASHRDCCEMDEATLAARREATATRVGRDFGIPEADLYFLRLRDGKLPKTGEDAFEGHCRSLAEVMAQARPTQIFTTGSFEWWPDHIAADQMTNRAIVLWGGEAELYHYNVWSWIKLPIRKVMHPQWEHAQIVNAPGNGNSKRQAIRQYLNDHAPCGRPYCGELDPEFLDAFDFDRELFFRVPNPQ